MQQSNASPSADAVTLIVYIMYPSPHCNVRLGLYAIYCCQPFSIASACCARLKHADCLPNSNGVYNMHEQAVKSWQLMMRHHDVCRL